MVVQLRRMAFINKNIAPEGWTFAPLISVSSVGTPVFISFLGFTYIELQMDKLLPKSECRFYLDGMTLNRKQIFFRRLRHWWNFSTSLVELFLSDILRNARFLLFHTFLKIFGQNEWQIRFSQQILR